MNRARQPIKVEYVFQDGRTMQKDAFASDIKELFGLKSTQHWPKEGMPERTIQGIRLYVNPLAPLEDRTTIWRGRLARKTMCRLMAVCPVCDRHVTYGRLHQHMVVHEE
jgi:hypothetical protein